MAVKRATKTESVSMAQIEELMKGEKKSTAEKMFPLLMILIAVMGFGLGSMWTRLKTLEGGAGGGGVKDRFRAYAKELKLNERKFVACLGASDSKKDVIDADLSDGSANGISGTPGFFINGRFLGGAFPVESFKDVIDKELAGKATDNLKDYSQYLQDAAAGGAFNPVKKDVQTGSASVRGNQSAAVTIVEYSDFQCPYCSRALPTVNQLLTEYGDKVKLVYKHFPLEQIHPNARLAAVAAECAKDQGKFWEMHDKLFEKQTEWSSLSQG